MKKASFSKGYREIWRNFYLTSVFSCILTTMVLSNGIKALAQDLPNQATNSGVKHTFKTPDTVKSPDETTSVNTPTATIPATINTNAVINTVTNGSNGSTGLSTPTNVWPTNAFPSRPGPTNRWGTNSIPTDGVIHPPTNLMVTNSTGLTTPGSTN